jgi:protein phosphatase
MTEEEAEASSHANVILQALGVETKVRVDLTYQQIRRGDTLLACSDGLFKVVRNDEIARTVAEARDLDAACAELVALANARGGPDNITVAVARFDGFGLQQAQDTDTTGHQPFTPPASY